jgi:CheY-like chemotaxis protein
MLPSTPVCVEGDPTRLAQVIANLVNNAAKYTDEGGRIGITVEAGEFATVRIQDNGRGIEAEAFASLFQLFYQADTNLDRTEGGLGVGLALVKSLVQLHGGTVEAHSAGRGQGSEFTVRLPLASRAETTLNPDLPQEKAATQRLGILVVDDNIDAARTLAKLLEILGHQTFLAHDGQDAIEQALRHRPDIVFLDIGLPRGNGYQVCESLRGAGLTRQLIVACTGYGRENDRQLSSDAGFDVHLVKPVSLSTIQNLLAMHATGTNPPESANPTPPAER